MAEPTENTNTETPANTNNDAVIEEVRGIGKILNSVIDLFKSNAPKDEPKPPEPANTDQKALQELEAKFQQQLKEKEAEMQKKIEELTKKQDDNHKTEQEKLIKNATAKAKELGFIPTDDKAKEDWLVKSLQMDFEGTLAMIEAHPQHSTPKPISKENQDDLAKQIARKNMKQYFY